MLIFDGILYKIFSISIFVADNGRAAIALFIQQGVQVHYIHKHPDQYLYMMDVYLSSGGFPEFITDHVHDSQYGLYCERCRDYRVSTLTDCRDKTCGEHAKAPCSGV